MDKNQFTRHLVLEYPLPLQVKVSKKKHFILNINNYRNAHHRVLSTAKRNYHDIVKDLKLCDQLDRRNISRPLGKVFVHYEIFPKTKRKFDLMNVVSIIDKFMMDGLIESGVIADDNIDHVPFLPTATVGSVSKDAPHVMVKVFELIKNK